MAHYLSASRIHHQTPLTAEGLGHAAVRPAGHLCSFALLALGVLTFIVVAATYRHDDPLIHASSHLTSLLTSTSPGSTFRSAVATHDDSALPTSDDSALPMSDDSALPTSDDILGASNSSSLGDTDGADGSDDVAVNELLLLNESTPHHAAGDCDPKQPIDCSEQEVFHLMMRTAIETFRDVHFYRFGKPARGDDDGGSCDMAWRFLPKDARRAGFFKDYRRFRVARSPSTCAYSVLSIGEYHTGVNARKKKPGAKKKKPADGDAVNDGFTEVESEAKFRAGRYLVYAGGGDRCKNMNHYLWSFLCALGEAQYLNRTLVMDLSICLFSRHASTDLDEEGKDFRFYFDFEHLRDSARILDQRQFWAHWELWQKDGLSMHLVENFHTTPMKLAKVRNTLIVRKFGTVEPDNYWYRVCEGETKSVIQRPWHMIRMSHRLMGIASGIATRISSDFDSVYIVAADKAGEDAKRWPNLATDTSTRAPLSTLGERIEKGRRLYVASSEPDTAILDSLKGRYMVYFLDDFRDLWGEESEWYAETKKLNSGLPVEFDGYMRHVVNSEVFRQGKTQLRAFNDLMRDCKDGDNSCPSSS